MLELRPRVEEITGYQEGAGSFLLPLISTRTSDSRVAVQDGETAVIGGLTVSQVTVSKSGIPSLVDLPVLGGLFGFSEKRERRRDLLVMVTPHILDPGL